MKGIISPIITPLKKGGLLDVNALEKISERMIEAGIAGIFVSGTTGEFSSLSFDFKVNLGKELIGLVKSRVPVLWGISSNVPAESVELAGVAQKQGAGFVVATPPFYFKMSQDEVFNYYSWLVSQIDLPLYLYNIPSLTKVSLEPETVLRLSEIPGIVGLKDSSGETDQFKAFTREFRHSDFEVFMGPEEMLSMALRNHADGGVNGGTNIFPEWYIQLFEAHEREEHETVDRLQQKILHFSNEIYAFTTEPNAYLKGLKAAMAVKGLCQNHLASPLLAYREDQSEQIAEILEKY
jgi:4-hydroxy-tetrahydrodipicolinate synthase